MLPALLLLFFAAQVRQAPNPPDVSLVRAVLLTDQSSFFLGENVPIHYCLDNISQTTFDAFFGSSPHRFASTVTDDTGAPAPRPSFTLIAPDELSFSHAIKPGERYCQTFELTHYVRFERPGTYSVATSYEFVTPV